MRKPKEECTRLLSAFAHIWHYRTLCLITRDTTFSAFRNKICTTSSTHKDRSQECLTKDIPGHFFPHSNTFNQHKNCAKFISLEKCVTSRGEKKKYEDKISFTKINWCSLKMQENGRFMPWVSFLEHSCTTGSHMTKLYFAHTSHFCVSHNSQNRKHFPKQH